MDRTVEFFYEISKIPRESGNEKLIAEFLCDFAKKRDLYYRKDAYNNVIIKKNTSDKEPIILQAHMDMVCEKEKNLEFDFEKDSINVFEENGFLKAKGTTLGADNGIGVAQILNILDSNLKCNIEAVFTATEETSMIGAERIDVSDFKSKEMINLDGFSENTILVESAGFFDIIYKLNYNFEKKSNKNVYKIILKGLLGGHSGFEIDNNKGNSSILLTSFLKEIDNIELVNFTSGTKFNVIPSIAEAIFSCTEDEEKVECLIQNFLKKYRKVYNLLDISLEKVNTNTIKEEKSSLLRCDNDKEKKLEDNKDFIQVLNNYDSLNFLNMIANFKHGVFNKNDRGEVTTSANLGVVNLKNQIIKIGMRSSKKEEEKSCLEYLENYSKQNNCEFEIIGKQPGFETKENSSLVENLKSVYQSMNDGKLPSVKSVHITVETGFFKEKIKDLEVAIISPKILNAHTVDETVSLESIKRCDEWLINYIKEKNK